MGLADGAAWEKENGLSKETIEADAAVSDISPFIGSDLAVKGADKTVVTHMRLKIDIMNHMNNVTDGINQLVEVCLELREELGRDKDEFDLPRGLWSVDVGNVIIVNYLKDIANRAIEIGDKEILTALKGLGVVREKINSDGSVDDLSLCDNSELQDGSAGEA